LLNTQRGFTRAQEDTFQTVSSNIVRSLPKFNLHLETIADLRVDSLSIIVRP
jgi:hypothetical protein